jgi:hypothetical protein
MFELVLRCPEALVEPVSDALSDELEALAVSVEDADADSPAEQALFGEPGLPAPRPGWDRSTLRALFETEAQATQAAAVLLAQDWLGDLHLSSMAPVPDEDWVRLTQSQFAPVEITPSFWIVPTWHEPPPQAVKVIRLDPGLAFGTGTHPTTRMCLRWITRQAQERESSWTRVLDYGCGSGILAIAAAYAFFRLVPRRIAAVASTTCKEAIGQPVFAVALIVGAVLLLAFIVIPYNTFGEDVKMLKDSGLTLIKVLAQYNLSMNLQSYFDFLAEFIHAHYHNFTMDNLTVFMQSLVGRI